MGAHCVRSLMQALTKADSKGSEHLAGERAKVLPGLFVRVVAAIHDCRSKNRCDQEQGERGDDAKRQRGAIDPVAEKKRHWNFIGIAVEIRVVSQSGKDPAEKRNNDERESSQSFSHWTPIGFVDNWREVNLAGEVSKKTRRVSEK